MWNGKLFWSLFTLVLFVLAIAGAVVYSNIKYAQEGTVQVVTKWGAIWLPREVASSSRSITDTGTTAWIWRSPPMDSARVISQARRPPVTASG